MANIRKAPLPPLTDSEHAFLMKEYELLRTSVDNAVGELRNLDRWVLVTTAAVWTWILTNYSTILRSAPSAASSEETAPAPSSPPWIVLLVPVFIVVIFLVKTIAANTTLDLTNKYLRYYVEAEIGPREAKRKLGFETYFFEQRQKKTLFRMARIRAWSYGYYVALIIVYITMAIMAKHASQ